MSQSTQTGARTEKTVPLRIKIIFLVMVLLVMSSGAVIYVDTPIFYYGAIAISVLIILIIVYFSYYIIRGKPELFADEADSKESEENIGLEKVLEAEADFKMRSKRKRMPMKLKRFGVKSKMELKANSGKKTKDKTAEEAKTETPKKIKQKTDVKKRSSRLGTMDLEESMTIKRHKFSGKKVEARPNKKNEKVTTFLCPTCGSKELYYEAGLISGYKYHCKDCDYIGSFVIEKDFEV